MWGGLWWGQKAIVSRMRRIGLVKKIRNGLCNEIGTTRQQVRAPLWDADACAQTSGTKQCKAKVKETLQ